jgi:hypothetical protein
MGLAKERIGAGQWLGAKKIGLRGGIAGLHTGEAESLTGLEKWRAGRLADIERTQTGRLLGAEEFVAKGKADILRDVLSQKTGAREGLIEAGLRLRPDYAPAMNVVGQFRQPLGRNIRVRFRKKTPATQSPFGQKSRLFPKGFRYSRLTGGRSF